MTPPGNRNESSQTPLLIAIGAVGVALVVVIGIALGLALTSGDEDPETPPITTESPTGTRTTSPTTSRDDRPSTSSTTSSSTSATSTSSSTSTTSSTTSSSTTTTSTTTTEPGREDLGTGRRDVDRRGWTTNAARCREGDRAIAVVATAQGTRASACATPGGNKYYRGVSSSGDSLEAPIIVDEGDRIVAQNGSWKYQMSPDGMLITENNEVRDNQRGVVWGQAR